MTAMAVLVMVTVVLVLVPAVGWEPAPVGMCSLMFHTVGTERLDGPHCRRTGVVVFDSGCSSTVGRISAFRRGTS